MEYSGITRIDLLLDRYIAVAREARAPLLPAVLEIQKSLPRLASDYAKLVEFEQKTQSDLKKHAYKEKIEAIVRQVRETVTFLHKELHQLEMVNAPELYGDVLTKTDSLIGTDAFAERLERARQEAQALGELNAGQ